MPQDHRGHDIEGDFYERMDSQGVVEVEAWGLVPTYPQEREYAFVTGPDDRPAPTLYPNHIIALGRLLKEAIDQVAPLKQGHWPGPRHFRIKVEEVDGLNTSLVAQTEISGTPPLANPHYRKHLSIQSELALEDFRDGQITHKEARRAIRAATDARVMDVLDLVKDQVEAMQLRYMGRYTSYYIDKYEVMRLVEQLAEDIARGNTNVERAIRTGHQQTTPEPAPWIQKGEKAQSYYPHDAGDTPRRRYKGAS